MNVRHWFTYTLLFALVGATIVTAVARLEAAELAPAQRDKLVWIDQQLQKVVTLYRDRKTDDMQKLIGEIETAINDVQSAAAGDASIEPVLNPFRARLSAAQKLATYVPPAVAAAAARPMPKPKPGDPTATGGVSFSKDVVPILVGKCNNCHVTGNRGDLSMANYQMLMAGTAGQYAVVLPGKGEMSMIVEKMISGEMPPGGNKASDAEITMLIKWIDEGAKFDGMDPLTPLGDLAPAAPGATPNGPPQVVRATGNEKVHFMRDVAPILIDNCMDCHGAAQANDAASNYSMRSFNQLIRGGQNSRAPIKAGDPEGSFFVMMLRGTAKGPDGTTNLRRMPARRDPLEDKDMETILTWIKEGAKFDGESPTESIQLLWDIEQAKKATHEELTASRKAKAQQLWKRGNPDSPFEVFDTPDFTILGNLGPARMQEFIKQAEDEKAKITAALKLPTGGPLVKGKIVLMAHDKKFEYAEFGRVSEGRDLHPSINAHWRFNFIDCYAALAVQPTPEETAPLLSEVITGAYLDSLGSVAPRWFAVGTARNIAGKIHSRSPVTKAWEDALAPAMAAGMASNSVLTTNNLDNNSGALAQGFVKEMMKSPAWSVLMSSVSKGTRFDNAFQQAYKTTAADAMKKWLGR